jgi:hypothetical protein
MNYHTREEHGRQEKTERTIHGSLKWQINQAHGDSGCCNKEVMTILHFLVGRPGKTTARNNDKNAPKEKVNKHDGRGNGHKIFFLSGLVEIVGKCEYFESSQP